MIFDAPAEQVATDTLYHTLSRAAGAVESIAILPLDAIIRLGLAGEHIAPLVGLDNAEQLDALGYAPRLVEIEGWDTELFDAVQDRFPEAQVALRLPFGSEADLLQCADCGVSVFHLTADYHGRGTDGAFIFDLIRRAHNAFVEVGRRDEVTLLGSGGVIAAEHVPKAIAAGLDAVALDTPLLVALQARFSGDFTSRRTNGVSLPKRLTAEWGAARLANLMAAWRDQLLEVLGAMGLREVRRLRGEMGRVLLQKDLEYEAFAEIEGYLIESA